MAKKNRFLSWLGLGKKDTEQTPEQNTPSNEDNSIEQARLAEAAAQEAKAAEEARLAEVAAQEAKAAEEARLAEIAAQKAKAAEEARLAEMAVQEAKAAEEARLAEVAAQEAKAAEETRLAEVAAQEAKAAEEARLAEVAAQEAKAAEETRLAEVAAQEAKAAEEARLAEVAAQEAKAAEEARLAEIAAQKAKAAEEARLAEMAVQEAKAAEEARLAEVAAQEAKAAEEARLAEIAAQKAKAAEETRLAEAAAQEAKAAEEARLAEIAAQQAKAAEEARLAEIAAQEAKAAEEARLAEVAAQQAKAAEEARLAEMAAQEVKSTEQTTEPASHAPKKEGFFSRLKKSLIKTKQNIGSGFINIFSGKKIDDELFEELETQLLTADLGVDTTLKLIDRLTDAADRKQLKDGEALYELLKQEMADMLHSAEQTLDVEQSDGPFVILMVGVNGVGKTTTIGKLAKQFQSQGKSVMLAAGDTFRAAAVEQLQVWGERNDIPVVAQHTGADSASVIFDAYQAAKARKVDILIADTAGRLQNKDNLMQELEKIARVMKKIDESAPHEVMLTIDAGTGQNAISQVDLFNKAVGLSGIALTKLDGTAKGGVIFAVADKFNIPIRYIGVGEGIDDLRPFKSDDFIDALFSQDEQS
ncbi:fused signal recognition particle receptor [Pseudoalteromonas ulvae UL12]|uniref:signal recognition particle-docking protein FtsY n=1 Tax=Pseudoalteromonas ulvae TaxID=107327 RepID=UPI00186B9018|nr:signal recognition particle-docking protein FtsY [Pseudoalteromonas ulvae]MBE0365184.1 fused signal recognition particle receptor [Pseudoalteromonas ulvae UL12]